jgi:hypothetical protein
MMSKMASYVDVGGGGDDYPDLDPLSPKEVQVLKGAAASWNGQEFFLRLIVGDLADTETVFRVCPITKEKSSRANDGINIMATFREFYEWYSSSQLPGASILQVQLRCFGPLQLLDDRFRYVL